MQLTKAWECKIFRLVFFVSRLLTESYILVDGSSLFCYDLKKWKAMEFAKTALYTG